jgi:hypothetical protein
MELRNLAGRGAAMPDPDGDVRCRIDKNAFDTEKSSGIGEEIRPYVKAVLARELLVEPEWPGVDKYWKNRWLYTKAGSHSRRVEMRAFGERLDLPSQPTRREFAESVSKNMVAYGDAITDAGQSWKLEHYKTRAIYSADTISYYTFDYLLRPVEAVWANTSCLLDPGSKDRSSMYRSLGKDKGINFMLDFDDYNSQHTKEAMKVVIEEACNGADEQVLRWAVNSIDNEYVNWNSDGVEKRARTVGGLFSGHRATSFINTILNEAYCRMAFGEVYTKLRCLHSGDDVIVKGSEEDVDEAISNFVQTRLRANPSKQGLGYRSGEFLRVSFTDKSAGGYFARSVASAVSGSWVTDVMLDQADAAKNYALMAWTMSVRSGCDEIGSLLQSTFERRVPKLQQYAYEICTNRASVLGSPVRASPGSDVVHFSITRDARNPRKPSVVGRATDDFIDENISPEILRAAGVPRNYLRR